MEKKVKYQRLVIVFLAVLLVLCLFSIEDLKSDLENHSYAVNSQLESIKGSINSIYANVDNKLEEQSSLVTSFEYEYGELDAKNMKIPVRAKITPKLGGDNTSLFLEYGKRTVEMKKSEGLMDYSAEFDIDLFAGSDSGYVKLIIKRDGASESEELDWSLSSLHYEYLPSILASFIFDDSVYNAESGLKIAGDVMFHSEDDKNRFKNMKLVFKINDDILSEVDVSDRMVDEFDRIEISKTFPDVKPGDTFELYAEGEDLFGFIHIRPLKKIACVS